MRNPERIELTLDKLQEFWSDHPDFRLGQLIMVIAKTGEHNPQLFSLEDDEFLKRLDERKEELKGK